VRADAKFEQRFARWIANSDIYTHYRTVAQPIRTAQPKTVKQRK
jgi:hypothetical protein